VGGGKTESQKKKQLVKTGFRGKKLPRVVRKGERGDNVPEGGEQRGLPNQLVPHAKGGVPLVNKNKKTEGIRKKGKEGTGKSARGGKWKHFGQNGRGGKNSLKKK